jgi:putative transposase
MALRVQPELAAQGFVAGRDRIARLRRELDLRCKQKRKFKATTNSNHDLTVGDNLLNQTFAPSVSSLQWNKEKWQDEQHCNSVVAISIRRLMAKL